MQWRRIAADQCSRYACACADDDAWNAKYQVVFYDPESEEKEEGGGERRKRNTTRMNGYTRFSRGASDVSVLGLARCPICSQSPLPLRTGTLSQSSTFADLQRVTETPKQVSVFLMAAIDCMPPATVAVDRKLMMVYRHRLTMFSATNEGIVMHVVLRVLQVTARTHAEQLQNLECHHLCPHGVCVCVFVCVGQFDTNRVS